MVGADIISPKMAIPLVMGANIGTSITNTFVAHGHIRNKEEFERAFAGATLHDVFNLITVLILLPVEIISGSLGYPFLFNISQNVTNWFINVDGVSFQSPLKLIVSPLVKSIINIDKDVIKANAEGCVSCIGNATDTNYCWDIHHKICYTQLQWDDAYSDVIKSGIFSSLSDGVGGVISLTISIIVLCIALYLVIKTLKKLVLNGRRSRMMQCLHNVITKNGYLSILFGMLLTILVQSSSITTSVLTPLVGLSIISLEQMLPLTLGANLGTTCTAILASFVTESKNAVQVAMCHFFFNIIGIFIVYPFPSIRKIPLKIARHFGHLGSSYKWFSSFYLIYLFLLLPLLFLSISLLFELDIIGIIFGYVLSIGLLGSSVLLFNKFEIIVAQLRK